MNVLDKFFTLGFYKGIDPKYKIGVIGDAMLDEYFDVKVKKISPEFPIPVMHSYTDKSDNYPGGAANVAYQFKNFSVKVNLISFIDKEADSVFVGKEIDTSLCLTINGKIPRKKRFYSDNFPTYRWDVEQLNYGLEDLDSKCLQLFNSIKDTHFDVLIFSDYDKGVLSNYIDSLVRTAPISIVDPKDRDIKRWRGCTVFKPNKQEALAISGKKTIKEAGAYFLDYLECKSVVITQAGDGVTVFDSEGIHEIRPTTPQPQAESVIGAGDCFVAFLAMALTRKLSIREAAEVAWKAGVLYVKNRHNKPLHPDEIRNLIDPRLKKIIVGNYNDYFSNRDYKLVFTNGCFDILHTGHIETLRLAKAQGDKLVVAVNSDESVAELKPGRPFNTLDDRMMMLASLECVDFVVFFSEQTPLKMIRQINPDVIVKGSEYKEEDVVGYGLAKVVTTPMVEGFSTTGLVERIRAQV
jgi:D-beta-D-heptose 7-phosphate kinase/D-beta-D-heptose 1-phosphate adenosyltransferase